MINILNKDERLNATQRVTLDRFKINLAISKPRSVRHIGHIKQATDRKRERQHAYSSDILKNTENMIKKSLNRYTETISIDYGAQTADDLT
jgi:hypothetical protein